MDLQSTPLASWVRRRFGGKYSEMIGQRLADRENRRYWYGCRHGCRRGRRPRVGAFFLVLLALSSCATKRPVVPPERVIPPPAERSAWIELVPGIAWAAWTATDPPIRAWAVRVDLGAPGLEVMVTPPDDGAPGSPDGEIRGRRTSTALREFDLDLAVNASPFFPYTGRDGVWQNVAGLAVAGGRRYSEADDAYAVLLIQPHPGGGYRAAVAEPPFGPAGVLEAAGGFFMVLRDGVVAARDAPVRHPRTAVGLGPEGRILYLLVVDGRQPRWSVGITETECAAWLAALGAVDGMTFDGGGSTTLAIRDESGAPRVLNRPVDGRLIGRERVVANHLGFRRSE